MIERLKGWFDEPASETFQIRVVVVLILIALVVDNVMMTGALIALIITRTYFNLLERVKHLEKQVQELQSKP